MITEITLKLAPIPETQSAAVATFSSVRNAVACATKIMRQGIPVAAVELMDEVQMQVINKNGGAGGETLGGEAHANVQVSGQNNFLAGLYIPC